MKPTTDDGLDEPATREWLQGILPWGCVVIVSPNLTSFASKRPHLEFAVTKRGRLTKREAIAICRALGVQFRRDPELAQPF